MRMKKFVFLLVAMMVVALAAPMAAFADPVTPSSGVFATAAYGANDNIVIGVSNPDNPSETIMIALDPATGILVASDVGGLPEGAELRVTPISSGAEYDKANAALGAHAMWVYDISLFMNGAPIQPDDYVAVFIPVPTGYDGNRCWTYWIRPDGSSEDMESEVIGDDLVFATEHLSTYAVGYWAPASSSSSSASTTSSPVKQTGADTTAPLIGGIVLIAALGAAFTVARRKGLFTR